MRNEPPGLLLPQREKVAAKQTDEGCSFGTRTCASRTNSPHPALRATLSRCGRRGPEKAVVASNNLWAEVGLGCNRFDEFS